MQVEEKGFSLGANVVTQKWSPWQQEEGGETRSAPTWGRGEASGLGARGPSAPRWDLGFGSRFLII